MDPREPARISLAALPTPLLRLNRLGRQLRGAQIWMKRDDLTGLEFSGNKIRKLEYVVADAKANGCDTLVTEGTAQSNHCRATAAVCAKLGMHAVVLIRPQPPNGPQGNHLLNVLFGAEVRTYPRERFEAERPTIIATVLEDLENAGRNPRWIPMGASEPIGCWGYVRAVSELGDQLAAAGIDECDVVLAVSSGGTYAGALLGKLLHRLDRLRLWGIPVSDDSAYHKHAIGDLCHRTIAEFQLPIEFDQSCMHFIDGFVGDGYGIPYDAAIDALRLLARIEGIVLDPVYTAKAFTALLGGCRDGQFGHDRPVVFIHTGGIFSDFAWPQLLLQGPA